MSAAKPGRPAIVAVTGGIACGKSEVGRILAAQGVEVLDTDEVARALLAPGSAALDALCADFGEGILAPDGTLDRARLAARVFADATARRQLEARVHPAVAERVDGWRRTLRREGRHGAALVPLLYEAGMAEGWDAVICVVDAEARVRARLRDRGLTDAEADLRLAAQWPPDAKARRADYVIGNRADRAALERATIEVWRRILQQKEKCDA